MLDPVINFITMIFHKIGQAIGWVIAGILWPFVAFSAWVKSKGFIIKGVVSLVLILIVAGYGYFFYQTQFWRGFDAEYVAKYEFAKENASVGDETQNGVDGGKRTCSPSAIVRVTGDLIDNAVNQNQWVSSMLLYKLGLFGLDWDKTPYFDNKASFQRGVLEAMRRTTRMLSDELGRVRKTSQIDQALQTTRGRLQYDEDVWYVSTRGIVQTSPSRYREALPLLTDFNARLSKCEAAFDPRSDNLIALIDEVASALGSTSNILRKRSENYNSGWFDTRADDRFWFAYGQLYAYAGIIRAARADFAGVVRDEQVGQVWDRAEKQFARALQVQPGIISNGKDDGWIMPTHLATAGLYVLSIRANLTEIRDSIRR